MSAETLSLAAKVASAYTDLSHSLLVCLCTGEMLPATCAPMLRDPSPAVGAILGDDFASVFAEAREVNAQIHDGAVMALRRMALAPYRIVGWSHRLFPAGVGAGLGQANRGSAFHSGLAMSLEVGVDGVILLSAGERLVFVQGRVLGIGI
jgi:hypothetical protein